MGRGGSGPFHPSNSGPQSFCHQDQRRSPSNRGFAETSRTTSRSPPGSPSGSGGGWDDAAGPGVPGASPPLGWRQSGFPPPPGASMQMGPWRSSPAGGGAGGEGGGDGFGGGGSRKARASQSSGFHGAGIEGTGTGVSPLAPSRQAPLSGTGGDPRASRTASP